MRLRAEGRKGEEEGQEGEKPQVDQGRAGEGWGRRDWARRAGEGWGRRAWQGKRNVGRRRGQSMRQEG